MNNNAPTEPTEAERKLIADIRDSYDANLTLGWRIELLRAHVAAEVAKATAEDTELLNWLDEVAGSVVRDNAYRAVCGHSKMLSWKHGDDIRSAIRAARAQANPPT